MKAKKLIAIIISGIMLISGAFLFTACDDKEAVIDRIPDGDTYDDEEEKDNTEYFDGLAYALSDDESSYTVTKTQKNIEGEIVIPSEFKGLPVTAIGEKAFYDQKLLTKIVIPDSVTRIESGAFSDCIHLAELTLGSGVKEIGTFAFGRCDKLVEIYNRSSIIVTAGKDYSTSGYLGQHAVVVHKDENYESIIITDENGLRYYMDGDDKVLFDNIGKNISVVIPDDVTRIKDFAFLKERYLTSLTIGKNVKKIDFSAIDECYHLSEVYNRSSVDIRNNLIIESELGGNSFEGATYVIKIYTDDYQTKLVTDENGVVTYNDGDKKIVVNYIGTNGKLIVPEDATAIKALAFFGTEDLKSVTIPDGITKIPEAAFMRCYNLKSVSLGKNVEIIDHTAFTECLSLSDIVLPEKLRIIGWHALSYCPKLTSIKIPDSVTTIYDYAFHDDDNLTSVVLGGGIATMSVQAFQSCDKLDRLYYNGTQRDWEKVNKRSLRNPHDTMPVVVDDTPEENYWDKYNPPLYFYSEKKPSGSGNFWHYVENKPTKW